MPDPMTSYEQAQAEADERFYEEREDRDAAFRHAQQTRRRALWNARCTADHRNPDHCPCIVPCEDCGHLAADHEITDGFVYGLLAGKCDKAACGCQKYRSDE